MKKKSTYTVVVVGCGKIGALFEAEPKREKPASHAGAVMKNNKTELVGLVDVNAKNLIAAKKLFPSAIGCASLIECLKSERPDIVIIATPPSARLTVLKECVRFGIKIIICEKPLAINVLEAKQIKSLVGKNDITFVLNYQRRFSPLFARVREEIKKNKLGRIQHITGYYSNGLFSNGGHLIDALAFLIDDGIVSVIGVKNKMNTTHSAGDINVDALLTTKKGTTIVLQSFDQKEYGIHDIRIYGTKGSAVLTDYGRTLIEMFAHPSQFAGVQQLDNFHQQVMRSPLSDTKGVLAHAIECYEKRCTPTSSVASGLSVLRVLDAVARSAKQGGKKIFVQ